LEKTDAGRDWGQEEKGTTEDEMAGWHHCERLLLNHANTPGFLAPGGEEFNPGPEMRLDRSELLCNKVLLKYKEIEKASDIGIRRGQKEYPLASVNNEVI